MAVDHPLEDIVVKILKDNVRSTEVFAIDAHSPAKQIKNLQDQNTNQQGQIALFQQMGHENIE